MRTDKFVKVKKGEMETTVPAHALKNYLSKGWEEVKPTPTESDKSYDEFTVKQLREMAGNRNLYTTSRMRKSEIIDLLIEHDNQNATKPSNKGFTDNLIIE